MSFRIDAHSIPRYQTWGMMGVVLLLLITVFGFFVSREYAADDKRTALLYQEIVNSQKDRLRTELSSAQDYIRFMNQQADTVLMQNVKDQVDQAYSVATSIYQRLNGSRPEAEVQQVIREALRHIRFFNGRGYVFIDDMDGRCVLLPTAPQLEGQSLWDNQDDNGLYIMRSLIDAVKNPSGAGYSRYRWYPPGNTDEMKEKITYVRYFEPFDWVIGAGDYIFQTENDLKDEALKRISAQRFGRNGYIAVLDLAGNVLYTPYTSAKSLPAHYSAFSDAQERRVVGDIMEIAEQGGGFTEYDWFIPNGDDKSAQNLTAKLSLVDVVPLWDWVLVAGVYPEEFQEVFHLQQKELQEKLEADGWFLLLSLSCAGFFMMLIVWVYGQWLKRLFLKYSADIESKQEQIEDDARSLKIAARVFDTAREGIMVTDPDNRIVAVNSSFTEITGYAASEVVGLLPSLLASGRHSPDFYRGIWETLAVSDQWSGEIWNNTKSGQTFPEQLSISVSKDEAGEVVNYIATFSDVTDKKRAEEQLRYLAEYDDLTGLPNRRLLMDRVVQTIARAKRHELRRFSLMFIDLDRFKSINDSLGHSVGDLVLQEVSQRLQGAVREIDTVSRIGGDEFVILVTGKGSDAVISAANLAHRLLKMVSEPIQDQDLDLVVTPSIGIVSYPADGEDFETLLRNADAALYHAKSRGRNNYQFYDCKMNEKASARLKLENALRQAIEKGEMQLYYQPQYKLGTNELSGCEVLLRWFHAGELISPDVFIPLAEETGFILPLGKWVLEEGCRQGAEWLEEGVNLPSIAINVSAFQFRQEFYRTVDSVLRHTGFPPELLVLEVTESALMSDVSRTEFLLTQFRDLGIQIALDDFGTGYSSLAYLKKFSLDKLKIDRAFIDGLPDDQDDIAITSSILDVAKHLGLETIAEGVETEAQLNFLEAYGCDQVQGFYFSKPLPLSEFELLISSANGPS
ncbi:bifunctional diguanylate cyclase/phosphodiesterase [Neptunomonas japonica]|uniref:bifunctional diguanylate cyclase/phosphodiesterase n=1 Tax=Neptunomonas japonica TaxID=417574 RepID=UPI000490B94A|nr:cache domain-containing protein [Neptunomonas japonica]